MNALSKTPSVIDDFSPILTTFLQTQSGLVLRSPDRHSRTGDFDILVPRDTHPTFCAGLIEILLAAGYAVIQSKQNIYMWSFTVTKCFDGEFANQTVKIDVFHGLCWNGLGAATLSDAFFLALKTANAEQTDLLRDVATVIQKLSYAGELDTKTRGRLVNKPEVIAAQIVSFGLSGLGANLEDGQKWYFRYQTSGRSAAFLPVWSARVVLLALWRILVNRDGANGWSFQISGMDGSGKSTQVNALETLWRQIPDLQLGKIHLLPDGYPLPHKVLRRKATQDLYLKPYSEGASKKSLVSYLKITWYIGLFVASFLREKRLGAAGATLVFDRWYYDFVVDLRRAKIDLTYPLSLLFPLFSKNSVRVYLDTDPAVAVARKQELTLKQATYLSRRYLAFAPRLKCKVIDGNQAAEAVHRDILALISAFHAAKLGVGTKR